MNANTCLTGPARFFSSRSSLTNYLGCLALALILQLPQKAHAQSDDFDDGDDQGWNRLDLTAVGAPRVAEYPDDGHGGKAIRLISPAPPVPNAGPARAFMYQPNSYTDFYAAVDVVAFDGGLNQAFGLLFRATGIGLGQTDGYVFNYDPNQNGIPGGATSIPGGQLQINRITDEAPTTLTVANITLDPTRRHRFVLTAEGPVLTGRVYDSADLTQPLVTIVVEEATYPEGIIGLFNFSRVGSSAYTDPVTGKADSTFDNYFAAAEPPEGIEFPATAAALPGTPQVLDRTPVSMAAFHPAADGIRFRATTAGERTVNAGAVRLFLNGRDVSSQLQISGPANNLEINLPSLSANQVFEARIVLEDDLGRGITNEWSFDTFTNEFLDSSEVEVIEAEDYNFLGGDFIDNPPPSGWSMTGEQIAFGEGYLDAPGTADIDFFWQDTRSGSGLEPEYRFFDTVGTQAGVMGQIIDRDHLGTDRINDVRRQKYVPDNLPEYQVRRTEGGNWLNYTRTFPEGDYNAYLRVASRAGQAIHLDRVTGDPAQPDQTTERLGTFQVPNLGMHIRYKFVPLTDDQGRLQVLGLNGDHTLRLTLGGEPVRETRYTQTLNYMVFVPAQPAGELVVLEAAAAVTGPFDDVIQATIDPVERTIRLALPDASIFYRIRTDGMAVEITSIRVLDAQLVLTYEPAE